MPRISSTAMLDLNDLIRQILEGYALRRHGLHGLSHWGRVLDNGLKLAPTVGANEKVVTLFAEGTVPRQIPPDSSGRDDSQRAHGTPWSPASGLEPSGGPLKPIRVR